MHTNQIKTGLAGQFNVATQFSFGGIAQHGSRGCHVGTLQKDSFTVD